MSSVRVIQFVVAFVAALFLSIEIPTAQAADWVVKRMSGKVWIKPQGAQPASLTSGMVVPERTTITTRRGARVMLVRGKETMMIGPNSVVGIPPQPGRGRTTIYQQAGQVLFDVEKKHVKHFGVETPFLAAVVKGTQFVVSVGSENATVTVGRGRVAVADNSSGERTEITGGQSASTGGGLSVSGEGRLPAVKVGKPKTPKVAPPISNRYVRAISKGKAKNAFKDLSNEWGLTITANLDDADYAVNNSADNNGNGNGNGGGNDNGNSGNGNGNGGGNDNGNNGNGNGNGGGNDNGNNGNGNGNGGGNDNGNNGNGNGNGGGNGNGNNGNGNGNGGGNGNGNNGNGNGNGGSDGDNNGNNNSGDGDDDDD
ncbi:MAG: FecR family protein [Stappiaceae bacterium]